MKGPSGDQIQDIRGKISEKFNFVAHHKGVHRFCFINQSPYHETVDFDVHVGHFSYYDEHAKDGKQMLLGGYPFLLLAQVFKTNVSIIRPGLDLGKGQLGFFLV